jgi:predicted acylesterase/phospholipase RssA
MLELRERSSVISAWARRTWSSMDSGAGGAAVLTGAGFVLARCRPVRLSAARAQFFADRAHADPDLRLVGLVLGGGGARGAAHIGVLDVLERLRVPVDCVAGTSMGALVAGAWAAGLSPAQMREELARADWGDMFIDNPGYTELNFRSKRLAQRYLPGSETGLRHRTAAP